MKKLISKIKSWLFADDIGNDLGAAYLVSFFRMFWVAVAILFILIILVKTLLINHK